MNELASVDTAKRFSPPPTASSLAMDTARSLRQATALQQVARALLELRIAEFRQLAAELHSDSKSVGATPSDVQELIFQWATRTLDNGQ